jgi:hypothetical protein
MFLADRDAGTPRGQPVRRFLFSCLFWPLRKAHSEPRGEGDGDEFAYPAGPLAGLNGVPRRPRRRTAGGFQRVGTKKHVRASSVNVTVQVGLS